MGRSRSGRRLKTKNMRSLMAWLLTLVMVASVVATVPAKQVDAAGDIINLITSPGSAVSTTATDEGKCQIDFNNNSGYSSYTALANAGYTTLIIKLTCTTYTKALSANEAGVMSYYMHGSDYYWETQWVDLVSGSEITITQDLTKQVHSGDEIKGFGVLFDKLEPGSSLSYTISSAYLQKSGSDNGGSSSDNTDWEVDTDKITLSYTYEDPYDYREYYFYVNNDNSSRVSGDLKITFSSTVTIHWATRNFSVSADGNVLTVSNLSIEPNSSTSGIQVQLQPIGNSISSITFAGQVIGIGTSKSSGVELDYEMKGQQDKELKDTPVGRHGALSLASKAGYGAAPVIVDQSGDPFRLRGASMHGMHWFPDFVNKSAFQSLRDDFGVNMVRLVCYPDDKEGTGGGYLTGYQSKLDTLIEDGMTYCTDLGMYGIIDWHVHNWNPNDEIEAAKTFFTKYANKYKEYDNVIYEICNEPNGTQWYNGSDSDLYTYCNTIVTLIRSIDDDALIICGTGNWSQWIDQVANKPINDNKVLYTLHFYSGTHEAGGLGATMESAIAAGTPVFITEFGVCDASGDGGYNLDEADKWEALMEKYNISCACWSCCNKGESASYFKPGTSATGNWTAANLTKSGGWLFNTYRRLEAEEEAYSSQTPKTELTDENITFPTAVNAITYGQTLADSTLSTVVDTYGTYAWKSPTTKPNVGTNEYDVVYTPTNTKEYDYTKLTGYDTTTQKIVRKVSVTVNKKEISNVTFPAVVGNVDGKVKSGTTLSGNNYLSFSSDSGNYGTFKWNSTTNVDNNTTTVQVLYTLNDPGKYIIKNSEAGRINDSQIVRDVAINVAKIYTGVPNAPTLNNKTYNSISLASYNEGKASNVEYGIKSGSSDFIWQTNSTFTGLNEYTDYILAVRYAKDSEYVEPSNPGAVITETTYLSDENRYNIDLSKLTGAERDKYIAAANGSISYDVSTHTLKLNDNKDYTITGTASDVIIDVSNAKSVTLNNATFKQLTSNKNVDMKLSGINEITMGIKLDGSGDSSGKLTVTNDDDTKPGKLKVTSNDSSAITSNIFILNSGEIDVSTSAATQPAIDTISEMQLLGGKLTANASSDATTPLKSPKIVLESTQVSSAAEKKYSVDPVDKQGNKVEEDEITYKHGNDKVDTVKVKKSNSITLPSIQTQPRYRAEGWKLESDSSGKVYKVGEQYIVEGNVTFDAVYTEIRGTITADVKSMSDVTVGYTEAATVITITNNSNVEARNIVLNLTGTDADKFTVSPAKIPRLASGASTEVTVTMNTGYGVSDTGYKVNLNVKDEDILPVAKEIPITQKVLKEKAEDPVITGQIEITNEPYIDPLQEGYNNAVIKLSVKNNTNITLDKIKLVLVNGDDSKQYSLSTNEINNIAAGVSKDVTLTLKKGLPAKAAGYKTTVIAASEKLTTSAQKSIVRKVYLSDADSFKVDVSKVNEAGYIDIHNGMVTYSNGVLLLEKNGTYIITGINEALTIKTARNVKINLDNAVVKTIQGTSNYTLTGNSKIIEEENKSIGDPVPVLDDDSEEDDEIQATSMDVTANVKGASNMPVSKTMKLAPKKTMQLVVAFGPEGAEEEELEYTSSKPKIATVNENGKITAKKAGKTVITVTSSNGLKKAFTLQVVKKPVKKIKLKASKKTIKAKKTLKLKATITPGKSQATTTLYWKSSNEKIATVNQKGAVKGLKKGNVKITAVATDGSGKKATIKLKVK